MHEQTLITSACVRIRINIINSLCISHVWVCAQRELHWTPWVEFVPNGTYLLLRSPGIDKHSKHRRLLNWVDTILWSILTSIHIKIVSSHTVTSTHFIAPFHSIDSFLINAANVFVAMGMQLTVASNKMLASFLVIYMVVLALVIVHHGHWWWTMINRAHSMSSLHFTWHEVHKSAKRSLKANQLSGPLRKLCRALTPWALRSCVRTISLKCR